MSLLFRIVYANECTSTHHKLALDALRLLNNEQAEAWRKLFLKHFDRYLTGAKAPDNKFRDFRNHVLHVREEEWGGAISLTRHWYDRTVELLRKKKWSQAVYSAGVLSHYYTDPLHPFHTGQSEEECVVHRAVEWSVTKSYDQLRKLLEEQLGGFPSGSALTQVPVQSEGTWLEEMVREGARRSNQHYEFVIERYNLDLGRHNPRAGLDRALQELFAQLIGQAVAGLAVILERAIAESETSPPWSRSTTLLGCVAAVTVPVAWVKRRLTDRSDRKAVERIYREYQKSGKVVRALSRDEKQVRALHAEEVLQMPLEQLDAVTIGPIGTRHAAQDSPNARELDAA